MMHVTGNLPVNRTLILGVDAGDLSFIQAHLPQLPVFRRLLHGGVLRRLDTTSKLLTGSVWPTFYTGMHPGEHGVYHHLQWDPDRMQTRRVSADWLFQEPFWYKLARNGVRVTVADVPMMFPSRLTRGTEVVNWGAHDQLGRFHCNRPAIARDIRRRFRRHPMGAEIPVTKTRRQLVRIRKNLVAGAQRKGELIRHLLLHTEWDFFIAVFGECHRGGHILWPESDPASVIPANALLDVYQSVDNAIGAILDAIDSTATQIIVFSLHGMQSNTSQEHFVAPVMQRINAIFTQELSNDRYEPAKQRSLMKILRRHLPARLQNAIAKGVPVGVRDWVVSRATTAGYDWDRTPAFPLLADYNGYLRFNLKDRESVGCLQAGGVDHRHYLTWLKEGFKRLRFSDDGLPLVDELVPAMEVFPGQRSDLLPDLIITWNEKHLATAVESPALGSFIARLDTGRSGNHRHEGFMIVQNPNEECGELQSVSHIMDLAPILLRSFLGNLSGEAK
jgi:predicted AlkP superfamily phosphohydrolase/phosphomutase